MTRPPSHHALEAYAGSRAVLNGGDPDRPGTRFGMHEDAPYPHLNRWGVTGGNLRAPYLPIPDEIANADDGGIYLQFTLMPEFARAIVRYFDRLGVPLPGVTDEAREAFLAADDATLLAIRETPGDLRSPEEKQIAGVLSALRAFNGSTHAVASMVAASLEPGDVMLAPTPYYHSYVSQPRDLAKGGYFEPVETTAENRHVPTAADFHRWLDEVDASGKVKAVLLFAPHFTGEFNTRENLEAIFGLFVERHVTLGEPMPVFIEDGVYVKVAPFCEMDAHGTPVDYVPFASLEYEASDGATYHAADYTATVQSLAKAQCAAAHQIGFATIPPHLSLGSLMTSTMVQVDPLKQRYGAFLLDETPESFYAENNAEYARRIALIAGTREDFASGVLTEGCLLERVNTIARLRLNERLADDPELAAILQAAGIAGTDGFIPEGYRFVDLHLYPQAGNILFFDFAGMAGANGEILASTGHPFASSLHVMRHFLDCDTTPFGELVEEQHNGFALSSTRAMGLGNDDATRYVCKFQIAQMGFQHLRGLNGSTTEEHAALAAQRADAYDHIRETLFQDVFLNRMAGGIVELLGEQAHYRERQQAPERAVA